MSLDLVVAGGRVLLDSGDLAPMDVGIQDGRIVALGRDLADDAKETVDARGLLVLPGAVDPHVHFGNTMPFADEMALDTGSALLGGVTTIGCFLRSTAPYSRELGGLVTAVEERSQVDVFFHLQVFDQEQIDDLETCAREFGIDSFKFYLSGIPGIVGSVDEATLLAGMREARRISTSAVVAVHCENAALIAAARGSQPQNVDEPPLVAWERRHPALAEVVAIETAAALAETAGVTLYVVHISSADGMAHVRELQRRGVDVVGETTSIYLAEQSDSPNGLLVKQAPPIRDAANRLALWQGVRDGTVSTIGTDNTARSLASKNPGGGLDGSKPGLPMLGTHVAAALHTGVHEQGLPLAEVWNRLSRGPAEVFGLYPRKGSISLGADADLILVDLDEERVVDPAKLGSFADFSPLQGRTLRGWPTTTIKGGAVVAIGGVLTGRARGAYLRRDLSRGQA